MIGLFRIGCHSHGETILVGPHADTSKFCKYWPE